MNHSQNSNWASWEPSYLFDVIYDTLIRLNDSPLQECCSLRAASDREPQKLAHHGMYRRIIANLCPIMSRRPNITDHRSPTTQILFQLIAAFHYLFLFFHFFLHERRNELSLALKFGRDRCCHGHDGSRIYKELYKSRECLTRMLIEQQKCIAIGPARLSNFYQ